METESAKGGYDRMKKPHASTESGKLTKRESADEHQVMRENMGARREQRKRHHQSRKPCRKAIYIFNFVTGSGSGSGSEKQVNARHLGCYPERATSSTVEPEAAREEAG
jgi:hypothetical protein